MLSKKEIVKFILQENLKKKYHLEKLGLFGSFARGEEKKDSDIDIVIEFDNVKNVQELKQGLKNILEKKFKRQVDIARERYLKSYIKTQILSEAVYVE